MGFKSKKAVRAAIGAIGASALLSLNVALAADPTTTPTAVTPRERSRVIYDSYILGPGDSLQIELVDIPELSGTFSIGPDGTIYLPRLRALYVEGLTVEELSYFLTEQFKTYVKSPEIYVRPVGYRPIRIYVGGEVLRPGYYTLTGPQVNDIQEQQPGILPSRIRATSSLEALTEQSTGYQQSQLLAQSRFAENMAKATAVVFPTVFDALRSAQGITPFSDLSSVQVTRKQPLSAGGGRIRTQLDFLSLITEGDESQNIRVFDGDVVKVGKSKFVLRDQLLKAGQTNLSPQFIQVYVSGRVVTPGGVTMPQGSSLNQAINLAGGTQLLKGKVEFIRFTREGEVDRRVFSYSPNSPSDSYKNPILISGDIVRLRNSALSAGLGLLQEVATPLAGVYSLYSVFNR